MLPGELFEREVAHDGLTELHTVASMHERKALMSELADAFVALPGGYGTIEEVVEAVTWTQLGIHDKPVGLLDVDGYFEHLVAFLDRAVDDGLLRPESRALLLCDDDPARLLERLRTQRPSRPGVDRSADPVTATASPMAGGGRAHGRPDDRRSSRLRTGPRPAS